MTTKIYRCPVCGNVIVKLVDSGIVPNCCGKEMQLLSANTNDNQMDLRDKHVPEVSLLDPSTLQVKIGSMAHPMTDEHHICFTMLASERGIQVHYPRVGGHACSAFYCGNDRPEAVYAYCNLHNLWATHHLPPTVKRPTCYHPKRC